MDRSVTETYKSKERQSPTGDYEKITSKNKHVKYPTIHLDNDYSYNLEFRKHF